MKAGKKSNAEAQRGGEAERTDRWPLVRLGDVCEVINGMWKGVKPPFKNVGIIRSTNFTKQCEFSIKNTVFIDVEEKKFYSRRLQVGDLVVERSGGAPGLPVGRCVYIDALDGEYSVSNFTSILRVNNQKFLDPKYLWRYLIALYYQGATEGIQSNTTGIHNLDFKAYLNFQVPLPPLATQRAIVARLDSALARAGALEKRFAAIAQNAELSFKASLNEEFAGRTGGTGETSGTGGSSGSSDSRSSSTSRNPSDPSKPWPLVRLGEVLTTPPRNGFSPKPATFETKTKRLTLTATTSGFFKPNEFRYVEGDFPADSYLWLKPGDLLVQRSNTLEYVGTSCVFSGLENEYIYPDLMMKLEVANCLSVYFADYYLKTEKVRKYWRSHASGTAGSMPKINKTTVCNLSIPLPPLSVQRAIVARLDAARKRADGIAALARQAAEAAANLRKALLKEAFE
jgi:type I restriction enzyme S subunit